jgi:hypothetical protein
MNGTIARRKLRAGVFKHPEKPVWCICWHVRGRPRWKEICSRTQALRAFRNWKREVYRQIEQKKHERHISFPKPFRAGIFEHTAGSGVWWIGYYDKRSRPGDRRTNRTHRRREKIGSREAAKKAYADRIKQIRDRVKDLLWGTEAKREETSAAIKEARSTPQQRELTSGNSKRYWSDLRSDPVAYKARKSRMKTAFRRPEIRRARRASALITNNDPEVQAARLGGLSKAVVAAADPQVRARSLAEKMREQAAAIGNVWTEEQFAAVVQNLLQEILERSAHRRTRKRERGGQREPLYEAAAADYATGRFTIPELAEKYLPIYFKRDPDGAKKQMSEAMRRRAPAAA